jgi:hypothetical protein
LHRKISPFFISEQFAISFSSFRQRKIRYGLSPSPFYNQCTSIWRNLLENDNGVNPVFCGGDWCFSPKEGAVLLKMSPDRPFILFRKAMLSSKKSQ